VSQTDGVSGEQVTYAYDSLNRLVSAATTGPQWG
jgi:YD repeat-containing protein